MEELQNILLKSAHPQGGWGFYSGNCPSIEPTCLALLSLGEPLVHSTAEGKKGIAFVVSCINDSGWVVDRGNRKEAIWPTAIALFTLSKLKAQNYSPEKLASALVETKGHSIKANPVAKEIHANGIDVELTGWPWTLGTFSWVEPTAWSVLALSQVGLGDHPRVLDGQKFLIDRLFDEGGTNYGCKRILGKLLDTIPIPTSLTLLALQNHPEHPRLRSALRIQRELLIAGMDPEDSAWANLALRIFNAPESENCGSGLIDQLGMRDGVRLYIPKLAMVLSTRFIPEENPFKITCHGKIKQLSKVSLTKESWGGWIKKKFRNIALRGLVAISKPDQASVVAVEKNSGYCEGVYPGIDRLYDNFRVNCPLKGKKVFIKPNIVEFNPRRPIHTHPSIIEGLIQLCQKEGAGEILVGEGPGHRRNMGALVNQCGLDEILKKYGVEFVDINHDEFVPLLNMGPNTGLEKLFFCKRAAQADVLISVPKMKTHHWATVTLSLKNLFGIASGQAYGWPKNELHFRGIPQSIVDINCTRRADLVLVDGIIGMQGDGPLSGDPIQAGVMLMGVDPLAVDATCARMMGFDPQRIAHLNLAYSCGVGNLESSKIRLVGAENNLLSFEPPPKEFAN